MENGEDLIMMRRDNIQIGLMKITSELMSSLGAEFGYNEIPGLQIYENTRAIEVIRTANPGEYQITFRVENRCMRLTWDANKVHDISSGISKYDFGILTHDDIAVAGGAMLMYYAQAMLES